MAGSVQCKGRKQTCEWYENRDVDVWAVFQGKQLLTKGKGASEFSTFIDMLCEGSTNAVYTCKVFEDLTDPKAVKSNTPDDGSFNFRLNDELQEITQSQYGRMGAITELRKEMDEIKALLLEPAEKETDQDNELGIIGRIAAHPSIAPIVPALLTHAVNSIFKTNLPIPEMQEAAISGVPESEKENVLQSAIRRLKKIDPLLPEHLDKMATIGEQQKLIFDQFIKSLENWKC